MAHRRFVGVVLAVLVVVCLVAASGAIGYRSGWSDGVLAQLMLADGAEGGKALLYSPAFGHGPGHVFRGSGFGILGVLFVGLLLVLLIGLAMKAFAFHVWRTADGPGLGFWAHKRHKNDGDWPMPPWCRDWERPSSSEAEAPNAPAESEGEEAEPEE